MKIVGRAWPQSNKNQEGKDPFAYALVMCSTCEKPLIFRVSGYASWAAAAQSVTSFYAAQDNQNLSGTSAYIEPFFNKPEKTTLPGHIPEDVEKALAQAETNFYTAGHEEASATMYRRALERALKAAHPTLTGPLATRIRTLANTNVIPQAMADWADEIRLIGNDGAHDDGVGRDDLVAARNFCDAFLRYLITLPKEVELRRQQP